MTDELTDLEFESPDDDDELEKDRPAAIDPADADSAEDILPEVRNDRVEEE